MLASVCSGDQLNLTCHATPSETLIQWSLTIPSRSPELRFISTDGNTVSVTPFIVGQTVFQFLRTSTSPLTSLMVIDNVSADVNGTRVECSYGGRVVSTDIINVIGSGMFDIIICLVASYRALAMLSVQVKSWKWLHRYHCSRTSC